MRDAMAAAAADSAALMPLLLLELLLLLLLELSMGAGVRQCGSLLLENMQ